MPKPSVRLVCPNSDCMNKSPVWRKFDRLKGFECKNCNTQLVLFENQKDKLFNAKAKQELRSLGVIE